MDRNTDTTSRRLGETDIPTSVSRCKNGEDLSERWISL